MCRRSITVPSEEPPPQKKKKKKIKKKNQANQPNKQTNGQTSKQQKRVNYLMIVKYGELYNHPCSKPGVVR